MTQAELRCGACGEELKPGWKLCPVCQTPVPQVALCPSCREEVKLHWRACPSCGAALAGSSAGASPFGGAQPVGVVSPFVSVGPSGEAAAPSATPGRSGPSGSPWTAPELTVGEVLLEQYEIRGVLGGGGFARVYRAHSQALGEELALKAVPSFGHSEAVLGVLAGEFRAQERVESRRHVIRSYLPLKAQHRGMDWVLLPMELAERSLADWLREGREDDERLEEGLELLRQACRGVSAIHAAGLVHRDLKPENLLLFRGDGAARSKAGGGPGWRLKVADFGLARGFDRLAEARPELVGDGVGTPAYMAPEQVLAAHWKDVTESADLYALGMMLYELLDGDLPYSGSAAGIREKKLDERLKVRRPAGPAHLAELAMRCLERDPSRRPATAEELERQLVAADPEEESAFREAEGSGTEAGWAGFLKSYPEGRHAEEARGRLAALVAEREARGEAERKARAEAETKAKAEAERKAKAKAEAERKAKEEEARRKREAEEARRRAEEERKRREGAPPSDPSPLDVWRSPKEGLEYVFIPPGQYEMGASPGDDGAHGDEKPRHRVRVARGFWLGRTPVTVAAYRRFCDATGRLMPEAPDFNPNWQHGEHPIVNVSWDDAVAYCEWAGCRLPAEAEWEYAARAGTGTRYWWGDEFDGSKAWSSDNSVGTTQPVGRKPANPWGLHDVLGNVWEWCADPWHGDFEEAPSEAVVWAGDEVSRVLRGGSCSGNAWSLRVSYRYWLWRGLRYVPYGFRCARDV